MLGQKILVGLILSQLAGPFPTAPNYSARVDLETSKITGWARALAHGNGWDGWISIAGENYGVNIDMETGEFHNWAQSDMVIGQISFNCANQEKVCVVLDYKVKVDVELFNRRSEFKNLNV